MSPSAGLVLVPLFSDPSLNTRCGGIYSLISWFRIAASSTPLFGLTLLSSADRRVVCIYDYPGWANVMWSTIGGSTGPANDGIQTATVVLTTKFIPKDQKRGVEDAAIRNNELRL